MERDGSSILTPLQQDSYTRLRELAAEEFFPIKILELDHGQGILMGYSRGMPVELTLRQPQVEKIIRCQTAHSVEDTGHSPGPTSAMPRPRKLRQVVYTLLNARAPQMLPLPEIRPSSGKLQTSCSLRYMQWGARHGDLCDEVQDQGGDTSALPQLPWLTSCVAPQMYCKTERARWPGFNGNKRPAPHQHRRGRLCGAIIFVKYPTLNADMAAFSPLPSTSAAQASTTVSFRPIQATTTTTPRHSYLHTLLWNCV